MQTVDDVFKALKLSYYEGLNMHYLKFKIPTAWGSNLKFMLYCGCCFRMSCRKCVLLSTLCLTHHLAFGGGMDVSGKILKYK